MDQEWMTEYEKYLLSGNVKQAEKTKNAHINRPFFKYRCFDDKNYWMDWVGGTLYANSPKSFNDPFDCLFTLTPEAKRSLQIGGIEYSLSQFKIELNKLDKQRLMISDDPIAASFVILEQHGYKNMSLLAEGIGEQLNEFFKVQTQLIRESFRVSCFSENNASLLMWSHYTSNHQGFCIEYDFGNTSEISALLYPVVYNQKRVILLPNHMKLGYKALPVVLCKSPDWSYECEWRYINATCVNTQKESNEPKSINAHNTIKAIYLGVEANKHNASLVCTLKNLAKEFCIPLYEMRFDDSEYKLIPRKIDYQ